MTRSMKRVTTVSGLRKDRAFRKNDGTVLQLTRIVHQLSKALDIRKAVVRCFFDLKWLHTIDFCLGITFFYSWKVSSPCDNIYREKNDVTGHLTRIQPLEVWAVDYAYPCKTQQKLMFLEILSSLVSEGLFEQQPLNEGMKIRWKDQGVTIRFQKLINIPCKMEKNNISLHAYCACNWPTKMKADAATWSKLPTSRTYLWNHK